MNRMLLPLGAASLVSLALPLAGAVLNDERKAEVKVSTPSHGAKSNHSDKSPESAAASRPPGLKSTEQTDQRWATVSPPAGEIVSPKGSPRCVSWTSGTYRLLRCAAPFLDPQRGEVGGARWH